ncbi:aminotransferase class V-fold PLP-dependent enzyme [Frigidibacter sp. SD6-1]|uniref:pyridoxal-phosphate-dependent aminotransferase family protein n=1 Tax=Frigidibacter sp. SD6-1 TaxID=3032581 RepID=UPI0024E0369C|nr:aminotransferase class V-fold PLP-dependent enzyme [Frigidibacter sp. SD6-1]
MNLSQGRRYLAIPGPSVMPDRVLSAMHRAAPNIYEGPLHDLTARIMADLRRVARTSAHVAIYIVNGHGAWEAANANLFSRGDRALVASTGQFGLSWANSVRRMGVEVEFLDFGRSAKADAGRIEAALRADRGGRIKAVLLTHTDTASTVRNDVAEVRAAIDAAGHPALLAVDCIASMGCDPFLMDEWGVDVAVAASQKGLMVPPGLGFVWFSDKALAACKGSDLRTPYWDWEPRAFAEEYWQHFCGTAPTHHLFGLGEALTMILDEEGLSNVWARHERLARAVWAAVDAWGTGGDIALNVAAPDQRGTSVTAVRFGGGAGGRLRRWSEEVAGVTLGIPLGMAHSNEPAYGDYLRIGHMGHVNAHMVLGVLSVIEAGMKALQVAHGAGALDAATAMIAGA